MLNSQTLPLAVPLGNSGVITPLKTEATATKEQSEEKNGKIYPNFHIPPSRNARESYVSIVTANTNAAVDQILQVAPGQKLSRAIKKKEDKTKNRLLNIFTECYPEHVDKHGNIKYPLEDEIL